MRKKIFIVMLFGLFLIGITGCGSTNNFDIGSVSDIEVNNNNEVALYVKDGTLKKTGSTLVLENNTNKLLRYNEYYKMEIKKDNKWHTINAELYFNDPLWKLNENSKKEIELNWEEGYGELAPGEYRIIKEVYFESDTTQNTKFFVSAEFTIE